MLPSAGPTGNTKPRASCNRHILSSSPTAPRKVHVVQALRAPRPAAARRLPAPSRRSPPCRAGPARLEAGCPAPCSSAGRPTNRKKPSPTFARQCAMRAGDGQRGYVDSSMPLGITLTCDFSRASTGLLSRYWGDVATTMLDRAQEMVHQAACRPATGTSGARCRTGRSRRWAWCRSTAGAAGRRRATGTGSERRRPSASGAGIPAMRRRKPGWMPLPP